MVPVWDVGDRMRKALRVADISVQDMAEFLGVARTSVSNWMNGRVEPSVQTLRLWALQCGVDYEWLRDGRPLQDAVTPAITGQGLRTPGIRPLRRGLALAA